MTARHVPVYLTSLPSHAGLRIIPIDKRTRDKAIQSLRGFLTQRSGRDALPQGEMAKLWKGIFYCAYHCSAVFSPVSDTRVIASSLIRLNVAADTLLPIYTQVFGCQTNLECSKL